MKVFKLWVLAVLVPLLALTGPALAQFGKFKLTDDEVAKKIAVFEVGSLTETPQNMPPLFGDEPPPSLKDLLERLKKARADESVEAVIVDLTGASFGFAQLQELFEALSSFKAVDKDVYVHADYVSTGTYALASAASHISISPTGNVWVTGLYGETPYLKGMLDKINVQSDFLQCGDFKTAAEPLTRTGPSPESQEMTDWLMDSLYASLIKTIAQGRGVTPQQVETWINGGPYSAEEALKAGMIDSVKHRQDFVDHLENRYGESTRIVMDYAKPDMFGDIPEDPFQALFWLMNQLMNPGSKTYTKPSIAIVYVEGPIMVGKAEVSPFGPSSGAFSETIRRALVKAAEDETVKAVVLRVDSPGGSALASEIILAASKLVADKKPLVVSMGNVAGSGGYYVTCAAETIFADPATITASIGVVSGKLVTTGGWDKLGINWSANQRGEMAAMLSSAAPFNEEERARLRRYMDETYDLFKQHVVDARGKKLSKPIDEIAGGRVFTGQQALELGLVDKLGGLDEAIRFAADKAAVSDYELRVIPEPPSIFDLFGGGQEDEYVVSLARRSKLLSDSPLLESLLPALGQLDPQRVKAILQGLQCLELIEQEHVVTMMPVPLIVR